MIYVRSLQDRSVESEASNERITSIGIASFTKRFESLIDLDGTKEDSENYYKIKEIHIMASRMIQGVMYYDLHIYIDNPTQITNLILAIQDWIRE